MRMTITPIRPPQRLLAKTDKHLERGLYTSKSDVIRNAIRMLILEKQIGSVPDSGDSVNEIREIRNKLSKENINLQEINDSCKKTAIFF